MRTSMMRIPARVVRRMAVLMAAFAVSAIVLGLVFLRVPEALGIGRYEATAQFRSGAALYEGAEVTYRGVPVGKVREMSLADDHIEARLQIRSDTAIPAGVSAHVRSRSAVGEQYVELVDPEGSDGDDLAAGDVIPLTRTGQPVEIGPLLDNAYALADSLDADALNTTVAELGATFEGRERDLETIIDRGTSLISTASENLEPTIALLDDAEPLLRAVNGRSAEVVRLTDSLAEVTDQLAAGDADLRRLLDDGPGFSRQLSELLVELDLRLPSVLGPLNVVTDVLVAYDSHLAATLEKYPRSQRTVQSVTLQASGDNKIRLTLSNLLDPPECTTGYLPTEEWGSPFDPAPSQLPPLVYCQESLDDPRGWRGARTIPCPLDPAIRTGDASECLAVGTRSTTGDDR